MDSITTTAKNQNAKDLPVTYIDSVDTCPICHKGFKPVLIERFSYTEVTPGKSLPVPKTLWLIYRCPLKECESLFIGTFGRRTPKDGHDQNIFGLDNLSPKRFLEKTFPKEINNFSKKFSLIYNQALKAENDSLTEICGPGYGRALEFLIKDFCIHRFEEKKEEIENKFLSNCITDHIEHPKIKSMAKKAVLLRNDETHYIRKWVETDIQDLKNLIDITVSFIETELLAEEYEKNMTKKE